MDLAVNRRQMVLALLAAGAAGGLDLCADEPAGTTAPSGGSDSYSLREGTSALFAGVTVTLHLQLAANAGPGTIVWRHATGPRTFSAGELAIDADALKSKTVAFSLRVPPIKDGVAFESALEFTLGEMSLLRRTFWILPENPFSDRKAWLESLNLALFDPPGHTLKAFEKLEIGATRLTSLGALERVEKGIVILGEGLELSKFPALPSILSGLAQRGVSTICLAPASGNWPDLSGGEIPPLALRYERGRIVSELDKRLSVAAWPSPGMGFVPAVSRNGSVWQVGVEPRGWRWIEATHDKDTREIFCGFPLIAHWDADPTARYLFARILEILSEKSAKTLAADKSKFGM